MIAKRRATKLPLPRPKVVAGQRWLIKRADAPWRQAEDLTFTVAEVFAYSEHELLAHDVSTQAAVRGVEYATIEAPGFFGLNVPASELPKWGTLLP